MNCSCIQSSVENRAERSDQVGNHPQYGCQGGNVGNGGVFVDFENKNTKISDVQLRNSNMSQIYGKLFEFLNQKH